ncbi:hypothetical protein AB3K25_05075 [Leuconostoc sp. MS02]|uniref:Uncharacterized protein n=1 Tax=Leuconostoc aquikimchii TaxID=3236804 RepID=A0ABV3S300_9LACO
MPIFLSGPIGLKVAIKTIFVYHILVTDIQNKVNRISDKAAVRPLKNQPWNTIEVTIKNLMVA